MSERRVEPSESKAPALMSDSMVRLLAAVSGTLRRKSWKEVNAPLLSRAARSWSTTPNPTLRTAPSPKRMSSPTAAK